MQSSGKQSGYHLRYTTGMKRSLRFDDMKEQILLFTAFVMVMWVLVGLFHLMGWRDMGPITLGRYYWLLYFLVLVGGCSLVYACHRCAELNRDYDCYFRNSPTPRFIEISVYLLAVLVSVAILIIPGGMTVSWLYLKFLSVL